MSGRQNTTSDATVLSAEEMLALEDDSRLTYIQNNDATVDERTVTG